MLDNASTMCFAEPISLVYSRGVKARSHACPESAFDIHTPPDRWPMKLTRRTLGLIAIGLALSIAACDGGRAP